MASLIENLIDVLEKENTEYKELLQISKEKTEAIVHNNVEKLQDIVGREQKLIEKLDRLEAAREEHIDDIANVLNVPVEKMKVDLLIRMMEKQPKEQAALISVLHLHTALQFKIFFQKIAVVRLIGMVVFL